MGGIWTTNEDITECLRAFFISPEILVGSLPFVISSYWQDPATFAAQHIASDIKWAWGIAAIPFCLLATTYSFGSKILSPSGEKKALLSWPDYWTLKLRVPIALGFCILSFAFVVCGIYMVTDHNLVWGATIITSGLLLATTALASAALDKWTIREILPD